MTARRIDKPEPGFFRMRLVKGGPWVGARLIYGPSRDPETGGVMEERSWFWETWINGTLAAPPSPDPTAAGVWRVWLCAPDEIDEPTYRHLIDDRAWCAAHAPHMPEAHPERRTPVSKLPRESVRP